MITGSLSANFFTVFKEVDYVVFVEVFLIKYVIFNEYVQHMSYYSISMYLIFILIVIS